VGVLQLINKARGSFDDADEQMLGQRCSVLALLSVLYGFLMVISVVLAETFLTIVAGHVKASSVRNRYLWLNQQRVLCAWLNLYE
jgi:hypothetical protein